MKTFVHMSKSVGLPVVLGSGTEESVSSGR